MVHAGQLVARGADPYATPPSGTFVGANYPPLSYAVVAAGAAFGSFLPLRAVGILAMVAVAAAIAWRARASRLVAVALAASFLAFYPVQAWGPLVRADPLAVALTAFAVLLAGASWPRALASGALGALALAAKPTALFPLAAVLAYFWWRERRIARRETVALAFWGALALGASLARFDVDGLLTHLVRWNVLPFSLVASAVLLAVGVAAFGAFPLLAAERADGRMRAYLAGALAIAVLGGREGATINFLLDLAAASCLALAPVARVGSAFAPTMLAAQLAVATLVTMSGVLGTIGQWSDRGRVALAADLPPTGAHLAEDSGVLLANGLEPVVDDLFLWSRLVALGVIADEITPRARDGEFASVIAEVPLDALADAPGFERQRWHAPLVAAVLGSYRLEVAARQHFRYVPRRDFALRGPAAE